MEISDLGANKALKNNYGHKRLAGLYNYLADFYYLRCLKLQAGDGKHEEIDVARVLQSCKKLEKLVILDSDCILTSGATSLFIKAIPQNWAELCSRKTLTHLELDRCNRISANTLEYIANKLKNVKSLFIRPPRAIDDYRNSSYNSDNMGELFDQLKTHCNNNLEKGIISLITDDNGRRLHLNGGGVVSKTGRCKEIRWTEDRFGESSDEEV